MRHTRLIALALVATTALAVCGCGSSSKPLTRAELTVKANTICKRVNTKLVAINKHVSTEKDIARLAPRLAFFEQSALSELSKLTPPSELASDWKTIIAGAQTLAENTAKLGEYAKANNIKGSHGLIASSLKVQQQMVVLAKRDGLNECEQVG